MRKAAKTKPRKELGRLGLKHQQKSFLLFHLLLKLQTEHSLLVLLLYELTLA
jgi:hypothetical protein